MDLQVDSHSIGKRDMALKHLKKTQTGDLVVYDRGYPAVCFYKYHTLKNIDFCMRIVKSSNVVKAFIESGKYGDVVNFSCIEKSLRRCRKDKISTESLNVRLVRVDLPSGQVEILVSSLTDKKAYPTSISADLYHQRWGIKEYYKVLKNIATVAVFDAKNQLKDNVVRFMMKLAGAELYRLLISNISKSLSVIRPNRKFSRRDKRFTPNKYPMSYKRVC